MGFEDQLRETSYLYLTTTGRRTGLPRRIEIWFTYLDGRYYLISERGDRANWVLNILANPHVSFRVGDRQFRGRARVVESAKEPDLCERVRALSLAKYGWGDGLVVELTPEGAS